MAFVKGDETLTCVDCKQPFVFTDGEKTFYESKQFTDPPKRCKACRTARKADRQARDGMGATSQPQQPMNNDDSYGNRWNDGSGNGGRRQSRGRSRE